MVFRIPTRQDGLHQQKGWPRALEPSAPLGTDLLFTGCRGSPWVWPGAGWWGHLDEREQSAQSGWKREQVPALFLCGQLGP